MQTKRMQPVRTDCQYMRCDEEQLIGCRAKSSSARTRYDHWHTRKWRKERIESDWVLIQEQKHAITMGAGRARLGRATMCAIRAKLPVPRLSAVRQQQARNQSDPKRHKGL